MAASLPAMLAGVVVGVVARDAGMAILAGPAPIAAAGFTLLLALAVRSRWLSAATLLVAGLALGGWRGAEVALPAGPGSVQAAISGEARHLEGTVTDDPRPRGERQQVVLDHVSLSEGGTAPQPAAGRVLLWLPRGAQVTTGDRIRVESPLEEPEDFEGFAYRAYLARQGIAAIATARSVVVTEHRLGPIAEAMRVARGWLLAGLNDLVPEPEAALAAGIVLGVRSGIDPAINDAFAAAGLTHVVAISGWNIAIVAALAAAAARPLTGLPSGRWLAAAAAAMAVAAKVLLTGASPSVVRAALMAGGLLMARLGGSRSHALSALMLATLLMVVASPVVVWDVGFQLSALATAGLIWFAGPIGRRLARWPAVFREPVALTLAAQVTTLPIILLNFERLSLVAPLANVVVVPLVPIVMLTSTLAAVIGAAAGDVPLLGSALAWAAGGAAWLYLRVMIAAGEAAAALPMASVPLAAPAWFAAIWYPPVLLIAARRSRSDEAEAPEAAAAGGIPAGRLRPWTLVVATLGAVGLLTLLTQPDGRLHLVALDVGQGDAILIIAPGGETMLVDGGPDPDIAMRRLGEELPFWRRRLDLVVLTHPHEDHVAGLLPALERFEVGTVLDPGREYPNPSYARFRHLAADEGPGVYRLARAGDSLQLGSVALEVLFPSAADAAAPLPEDDINNSSVVMVLRSGSFSALLEGDAEAPVEELLLDRDEVPAVDVLKVGHHGSESSTTPTFLAAARPQIALISCGVDNAYGHPHAITLEHLAVMPGLVTHRTDLEGTIEIVVDANGGTDVHSATADAGSIGPWWFPAAIRRCRRWSRCGCRRGSSCIPGASHEWRPRPRASSARQACRWTCGWSRSPPCCMTSTSWRPGTVPASTERWPPSG